MFYELAILVDEQVSHDNIIIAYRIAGSIGDH